MRQFLIIFSKNEVYGRVKTRLAATMGHELALSVYQKLLHHTCEISRVLPVPKVVYYSDYKEDKDLWDNTIYQKKLQQGADLGARMQQAFQDIFEEGAKEVAIIGTDCLELTSEIIMKAFAYLHQNEVVIGPAKDGGYYLLAMKTLHRELFRNIAWSTESVLAQTLDICRNKVLSVHLLPELSDIDDEQDWENAMSKQSSMQDD